MSQSEALPPDAAEGWDAPDLVGLLDEAARDVAPVDRFPIPGGVEYRRRGQLFVRADARGADFLLGPEIALAASGTPSTGPSERGLGWVRFQPDALDRFARDRATAWFTSAWRTAQPQG